MRARLLALVLLAVAALAAAVSLRPQRTGAPPRADARRGNAANASNAPAAPAPAATPVPIDLDRLRDVFRFADEPTALDERRPEPPRLQPVPEPAAPLEQGPRLVGVVRRQGRLAAALALGGEVELALPGEAAAGVTVLSVTEDSVRVRLADGSEREIRALE